MKPVFYLCRSPSDPLQFIFASELPENYYSPGLFVVEAVNRAGTLEQGFTFRARQGEQNLSLKLRRLEKGRVYVVDAAQNGTFYFKALALDREARYSGFKGSEFADMPLYRLEPANMQQLERACVDRDFYFIGRSGPGPDEVEDDNGRAVSE